MAEFTCPKCGSSMVPMRGRMVGRGWNCSQSRWNARLRRAEGCDGVKWNRGTFVSREKITRPDGWLRGLGLTPEQKDIPAFLALAPEARAGFRASDGRTLPGGRLLIVDATAGSSKSVSMILGAEAIYNRVGVRVADWYACAFNVNAKESLEGKCPAFWPNIGTINGTGGRWQGFSFRQYKPGKIKQIFKDLTGDIPFKERPRFGPLGAFAERARDMLVYSDNAADRDYWSEAIAALSCRFPGLAKRLEKDNAAETVAAYLPLVLTRSMADAKAIDLTEQYSRPAIQAIKDSKWVLPWHLLRRGAEWTDEDIRHLATLIRGVQIPQVRGCLVDESQDLSPSQMVFFLAATWRTGELILVGDDKHGAPGDPDYKAGQGIFGWRGAGGGVLSLIPRLWHELTGERENRLSLSVTFRVPPEGCEYVHSFCPRMKSYKPAGTGEVLTSVPPADAFQRWLEMPGTNRAGKPYRALLLTRKNSPLAGWFLPTVKARKQVCLRGGGDFTAQVDRALFDSAGWYDDNGEYKTTLSDCLAKLAEENAAEAGQGGDDSLAGFLADLGAEIQRDPSILSEARDADGNGLRPEPTVGNLRRFVVHFASKDAPRVCSTVYRAKGDEADLVILDDLESLNSVWNGDSDERNAVAFVAATRQRETLLVCGELAGPVGGGTDETAPAAAAADDNQPPAPPYAPELFNAPPAPVKAKRVAPTRKRSSRSAAPGLFD